jgi:hypothetical protein
MGSKSPEIHQTLIKVVKEYNDLNRYYREVVGAKGNKLKK